jgi:hypothetical protein
VVLFPQNLALAALDNIYAISQVALPEYVLTGLEMLLPDARFDSNCTFSTSSRLGSRRSCPISKAHLPFHFLCTSDGSGKAEWVQPVF